VGRLDEHLTHRELRHLVAHSRVLRGEELTGAAGLDTAVFAGVPFALQPWERAYWRTRYMRDFSWRSSAGGGMPHVPPDDLELTVPIASADDTPLRAEPIAGILEPSYWIEGPITVRGTAWEAAARVISAGPEPPADPYGARRSSSSPPIRICSVRPGATESMESGRRRAGASRSGGSWLGSAASPNPLTSRP
jgi:hypothetical protein